MVGATPTTRLPVGDDDRAGRGTRTGEGESPVLRRPDLAVMFSIRQMRTSRPSNRSPD
jgi:hypothetical protein